MSTKETGDWPKELEPTQRAFLDAVAHKGTVRAAARGICNYVTHYRWMQKSELYRECFLIARDLFGELLTQEAVSRAVVGTEEIIIRGGKVLTDESGNPVVRRKPDRSLLKFLIERNNLEGRIAG